MSWIATVEDDNTEIGCVWATAIDVLTVTDLGDDRWAVEISGGSWTFLAGVFATERAANDSLQALALHINAEREGNAGNDLSLVNAHDLEGDGRPTKLPLGPQSLHALEVIDTLGDAYEPELIEQRVPLRVLNKMVPRYIDKQSDPIHGIVFSLTDEGHAALDSYRAIGANR